MKARKSQQEYKIVFSKFWELVMCRLNVIAKQIIEKAIAVKKAAHLNSWSSRRHAHR